ncbi:carboxypeptidase-like regulatory domain-containing protein, partial [Pseudomonas sp.]|uniref:carboxypeptidase-like regulatory domain-containing protein n=1 Tax=Pseudomonas sp. TaxID=306 RepID=UPI003BB65412
FGPQVRWLLPAAALVLVSASCGVHQAGTGSARPSGPVTLISGVVEARPGCPVERPSRLCKPRPLGDVRVEARSLAAGVTASARTRADGHYSFRLGQGRYVLVAVTRQVLPRCPHVLVSVTAPAAVRENINCDSGIR